MKVGIGYDIHRLAAGRKLILGGIQVPFAKGLLGHSDGDVLHHAVVDAVLGAAGLGDIGDHFSDRDPRNKGRDSLAFVQKTRQLLSQKGLRVMQIDSVLVLEKPKLGKFKARIRKSLADAWGLSAASVNVKAKTHEGLDAIGRGQAIACYAVAVLEVLKKRKS